MARELPEDLKEAVKLLAKSEKASNHSLRTRAFGDAISILTEHSRNEPDSPHRSFVKNIKLTYTRKLLEELGNLTCLDIDTWFDYVQLFLHKVPKEVEANIAKDTRLEENYKRFIGIWIEEAIKSLKQIMSEH